MLILKIFFQMMYYFNYFLKLFVFWLIYFLVNRIFFIINYFDDFSKCSYVEVITIFLKSFRLDASFIAYLSTLIILLLFVNNFFRSKKYNIFFSCSILWLNSILIFMTALIFGGEIALYSEWGSKLNFKALSHLFNPLEVFLTATLGHYLIMLFSISDTPQPGGKQCQHSTTQHSAVFPAFIMAAAVKSGSMTVAVYQVSVGGCGQCQLHSASRCASTPRVHAARQALPRTWKWRFGEFRKPLMLAPRLLCFQSCFCRGTFSCGRVCRRVCGVSLTAAVLQVRHASQQTTRVCNHRQGRATPRFWCVGEEAWDGDLHSVLRTPRGSRHTRRQARGRSGCFLQLRGCVRPYWGTHCEL